MKPTKPNDRICPHCDMDTNIRNPSGYCDHLFYPNNDCKICKLMRQKEVVKMKPTKPTTERKESINYCLHDYKNHHYWEKVGVENGKIVYQCSQCRKCSYEEINMIGRLL